MLRNLPNKYTRDKLLERLHVDGLRGDIDFAYLPIDFRNKCNVGYAFLNFRSPEACLRFAEGYNGMGCHEKLPGFNSKKVLEVSPARIQGLEENVRRLQNSPVMAQILEHPESCEWLPVLMSCDGEAMGFPVPPRVQTCKAAQPRSGRAPRGRLERRRDLAAW